MAKRKNTRRAYRPGGGELSRPPDSLFAGQDYLRGEFMEIVWSEFPKLQSSLRKVFDQKLLVRLIELQQTAGAGFFGVAKNDQHVQREMKAWAQRRNFRNDWCVEWLLAKVYAWLPASRTGTAIETMEIRPAPYTPIRFLPFLSSYLADWDPTEKTYDAFSTESLERFEVALNAYGKIVRDIAKAAGYGDNSEIRQLEHLHWLARSLINSERPVDIWA